MMENHYYIICKKLEENGFEMKPRSNTEVMEMLVAGEENRYVRKLVNLISRFISNFKVKWIYG